MYTVELHVGLTLWRLMRMQQECTEMAGVCEKRGMEKTGRRLRRSASGIGDIVREIENDVRQGVLLNDS